METRTVSRSVVKKVKVNWANECITGAMLSTVFTIMASHAGMNGVAAGSLESQLHELIVIGGTMMSVCCSVAAFAIVAYQIAETILKKIAVTASGSSAFSGLQTAKFIKIFLP